MTRRAAPRLELLQGTLDLLILRTLLFGPSHGHAIGKHIRQTSEDLLQVETGSLYPALHRLEARGLIDASWQLSERESVRKAPLPRPVKDEERSLRNATDGKSSLER